MPAGRDRGQQPLSAAKRKSDRESGRNGRTVAIRKDDSRRDETQAGAGSPRIRRRKDEIRRAPEVLWEDSRTPR